MDKLTADLVSQLLKMTQQKPGGNQGIWNADLGFMQQPSGGPMWYGEGDLAPYNVASNGMIGEATGDGYVNAYDKEGNFLERSKQKSGAVFSPELLKGAAAAAAMYAGGSGLNGLLGGSTALAGAPALGASMAPVGQMTMAEIMAGLAPADAALAAGGAGLDAGMAALAGGVGAAAGSAFQPIQPFNPSPFDPITAETLGLKSLTGTLAPLAGAVAPLAASGAEAGKSFLDKLGDKSSDFFSNPLNLLNTAGVLGSLYENSQSPDPVNTTATENKTSTATRNLDPAISEALFGADRSGGLMGQMSNYFAKNPTGQNETMQQAQTGLRGLLTNPDVLSSLYKAGAAGQGLLTGGANAGAKPWWWRG